MITYDDFAKLDIRIGTILEVEKVPETDKLLKLKVDVGEDTPRTLVAGIAEHFEDSAVLVGKQLPILTNLKHRKIRGIESEGMILAAKEDGSGDLALLHPSQEIKSGSQIG